MTKASTHASSRTRDPKLYPRSRDELSFTSHNGRGGLINWIEHSGIENDTESRRLGRRYFKEISRLAEYSDHQAFDAMRFALCSSNWDGDFGQEAEFSALLAEAAIVGLRAMRDGAPAFDRENPPDHNQKKRRRRVQRLAHEQRQRQAAGNNVIPFPSSSCKYTP